MDLTAYRNTKSEQDRIRSLLDLIKRPGNSVLDIGSRDGYVANLLTHYFKEVTALDLSMPELNEPRITCLNGNVCSLPFPDNSFDLVFCAEVLEHIPTSLLKDAVTEISRVAKKAVIIGVPYKQDIRFGRTTCLSCGCKNPPWGHVNVFDEAILKKLFADLILEETECIGKNRNRTNDVSKHLMDFAGNPYGTYIQDESCIHCSKRLTKPLYRNILQKICTRLAIILNKIQSYFVQESPNWIHCLFAVKSSELNFEERIYHESWQYKSELLETLD